MLKITIIVLTDTKRDSGSFAQGIEVPSPIVNCLGVGADTLLRRGLRFTIHITSVG